MGTRSTIAIANADGTVQSVYCHWDGYVSNNGFLLLCHYQDVDKVNHLGLKSEASWLNLSIKVI